MTDKEKAKLLWSIIDAPTLTMEGRDKLRQVADELDPPKPELGTVVEDDRGKRVIYTDRGWVDLTITDERTMSFIESIKPDRILALDDPGEEALSDMLQEIEELRDTVDMLRRQGRDTPVMTLREYYAGLAMQGLLASGELYTERATLADDAVRHADALIAELQREVGDD